MSTMRLQVLNIAETDMLICQPTHMPKLSAGPAAWRVDHLNEVARLESVEPFEHAQVGDCIETATPDTLSH